MRWVITQYCFNYHIGGGGASPSVCLNRHRNGIGASWVRWGLTRCRENVASWLALASVLAWPWDSILLASTAVSRKYACSLKLHSCSCLSFCILPTREKKAFWRDQRSFQQLQIIDEWLLVAGCLVFHGVMKVKDALRSWGLWPKGLDRKWTGWSPSKTMTAGHCKKGCVNGA